MTDWSPGPDRERVAELNDTELDALEAAYVGRYEQLKSYRQPTKRHMTAWNLFRMDAGRPPLPSSQVVLDVLLSLERKRQDDDQGRAADDEEEGR